MILSFIAIVFFTALAEWFIPKGDYAKYVSFVLGIVLIAAAIKPVMQIRELPLNESLIVEEKEYAGKEGLQIESAFSRRIEQYIQTRFGIQATVTADLQQIKEVLIRGTEQNRKEIARELGISEDKVRISR